jgi:phosphoribosylformimino-5-aminoimidazole carboxamide ribotide isomerase
MQVIPSLDLQGGRSRLVFWPGASTGTGTPTDRPDRISRQFVDAGAPLIHLVDLDGARSGRPVNTDAIGSVARAVATPLQVAGGIDGPEQIELAFAAGATRVVVPLWVAAESSERLAACVRIAGDWLAVGLDARPERLAEYPWRRPAPPTLEALVAELGDAGVRRLVLSHGGAQPDPERLAALRQGLDVELLIAGGITDIDTLRQVRAAGIDGVILGEALFTGAIDLPAALEAAA